MPREKELDCISRWARFSTEKLTTIGDIELAVLKIHLVLEDALKFVLAKRLGMPDDAFFDLRIEFKTLLDISMAGIRKAHLVGALRKLNEARNHISHRVESAEVPDKLAKFVQEVGRAVHQPLSWPVDTKERLAILQKCLDETAVALFEIALDQE